MDAKMRLGGLFSLPLVAVTAFLCALTACGLLLWCEILGRPHPILATVLFLLCPLVAGITIGIVNLQRRAPEVASGCVVWVLATIVIAQLAGLETDPRYSELLELSLSNTGWSGAAVLAAIMGSAGLFLGRRRRSALAAFSAAVDALEAEETTFALRELSRHRRPATAGPPRYRLATEL